MLDRWKKRMMAGTAILATCFAVGPDQQVARPEKNPPTNTLLAVATTPRVAAQAAPITENPPVITPPVVEDPTKPSSAATGPIVTAAQERPTIAVTAAPLSRAKNSSPISAQPNAPIVADVPTPTVAATTGQSTVAKSTPATRGAAQEATPPNAPVAAASTAVADAPRLTFDRRILSVHNRERQNLGLEPLRWNPALAQSAQRWAEHLAATGRFEHAPENHSAPEGENLWAGTKGYFAPEAMVDAWIREKRYFRFGVFPDNSTTGRVEDVGHYTQVVWRATTQVGCAEAAGASEEILVCRYGEAGNYRGETPF